MLLDVGLSEVKGIIIIAVDPFFQQLHDLFVVSRIFDPLDRHPLDFFPIDLCTGLIARCDDSFDHLFQIRLAVWPVEFCLVQQIDAIEFLQVAMFALFMEQCRERGTCEDDMVIVPNPFRHPWPVRIMVRTDLKLLSMKVDRLALLGLFPVRPWIVVQSNPRDIKGFLFYFTSHNCSSDWLPEV